MLRGHSMKGAVIGGNLRCFLKLAGTPYMPGFENCILFLESFSCNEAQSETYICQLKQMGAFARASGVLLGCFSKLEKEGKASWLEELILDMTQEDGLPVAKTEDIGHQDSSKCLIIGKEYMFS